MVHQDDLKKCDRCGSNLCYSPEPIQGKDLIRNYYCFGCGFNTNSICKVDSEFYNQQMILLPDLYKDLAGEDGEGKVWLPAFVQSEKGMLYADGTNGDNWAYCAIKMIPTTEEDDELIRKEKYKPDNSSKRFFSEANFKDALFYLGMVEDEEYLTLVKSELGISL